MIIITDIMKATISVAEELSKKEQLFLAGDIQNFLQTKKGIICEVRVT